MKVITAGHQYELLNAAGTRAIAMLTFVHKKEGKLLTDGTTSEEVILAVIDRIEFLDTKFPCKENKAAVKSLKAALDALNKRTADRVERGVEGKEKL